MAVGGREVRAGGGTGRYSIACLGPGFLTVTMAVDPLDAAAFAGTVILCEHDVFVMGLGSSSPTLSRVSDSTSPSSLSPNASAVIVSPYGFRHPLAVRLPLCFLHLVTIAKSSLSLYIERHVTANRIVFRLPASG